MANLWTLDDIAEYLGITVNAAQKRVERAGLAAVSREPGRKGKNLYRPGEVRQALTTGEPWRTPETD